MGLAAVSRTVDVGLSMSDRCYLDNAATSWPKPESVLAAMDRYHREFGVAAGRGATRAAAEVDATIARCRSSLSGRNTELCSSVEAMT